jgi:hypothetical protein
MAGIMDKETRQKMVYAIWKNKVVELIANDTRINTVVKLEEIKCVLRNDGHYPRCYQQGDYPEDAWQAEIQAIGDSQ